MKPVFVRDHSTGLTAHRGRRYCRGTGKSGKVYFSLCTSIFPPPSRKLDRELQTGVVTLATKAVTKSLVKQLRIYREITAAWQFHEAATAYAIPADYK